MSTTGIVRRIDDLGRVVIPKEIRKTLRIKEGDPLEISIINDNIMLKKYSSIEDFQFMFSILIEKISNIIKKEIIVFDWDKIICASSYTFSSYINKNISNSLYDLMDDRKMSYLGNDIQIVDEVESRGNFIFSSIVPNGDVVGGVLILDTEEITDEDKMFLDLIIDIFVKYIEE